MCKPLSSRRAERWLRVRMCARTIESAPAECSQSPNSCLFLHSQSVSFNACTSGTPVFTPQRDHGAQGASTHCSDGRRVCGMRDFTFVLIFFIFIYFSLLARYKELSSRYRSQLRCDYSNASRVDTPTLRCTLCPCTRRCNGCVTNENFVFCKLLLSILFVIISMLINCVVAWP